MDINETIMWITHAQTSMRVSGDAYGAKMLGEAVAALRARLAEVEAQRDELKNALIYILEDCYWKQSEGGDNEIGTVAREALAKLEETK